MTLFSVEEDERENGVDDGDDEGGDCGGDGGGSHDIDEGWIAAFEGIVKAIECGDGDNDEVD